MWGDGCAKRVSLGQNLPSGDHPEEQSLRHIIVSSRQPIERGKVSRASPPVAAERWAREPKRARECARVAGDVHKCENSFQRPTEVIKGLGIARRLEA